MPPWLLAIDFGTSFTAAATRTNGRVDRLEIEDAYKMASLAVLDTDGERWVVGRAATNRVAVDPERTLRTPKASLGQPAVLLGGARHEPAEAVAAVLAKVYEEALRQHDGRPPEEVRLTRPAKWQGPRAQALRDAAGLAGIEEAKLEITEPEAACWFFAEESDGGGDCVAVYDLGGGTFDTAVLERTGEGFVPAGHPDGDEELGGERFDDLLMEHLREQVMADAPEQWEAAESSARNRALLRVAVREAKEALSEEPSVTIPLPGSGDHKKVVTQHEFEALVRPHLEHTLEIFERTLENAGVAAKDLAGIYLTGGASRTRLVTPMLEERFGRVRTKGDPKTIVALGAVGERPRAEAVVRSLPVERVVLQAGTAFAADGQRLYALIVPEEDEPCVLEIDPQGEGLRGCHLPAPDGPGDFFIAASRGGLALAMAGKLLVFDNELNQKMGLELGLITHMFAGDQAVWARSVPGQPTYWSSGRMGAGEHAQVPVAFTRVGLTPEISDCAFGESVELFWGDMAVDQDGDPVWGDPACPWGFDFAPLSPDRNDAVALMSKGDLKLLNRTRRSELILWLSRGASPDVELPEERIDQPPWLQQVMSVAGVTCTASAGALTYDGQTVLSPRGQASWIASQHHGLWAIDRQYDGLTLYRWDDDRLREVLHHEGSALYRNTCVWAEGASGPSHAYSADTTDGLWLPLTRPSDGKTVLTVLRDGEVDGRIERDGISVPLSAHDGELFCTEPQPDGPDQLVALRLT